MEPGQVLTAVGPAAALTLLILLATHEPWRAAPRATPRWRAAGGAVAVAGAFVLAAVCLGYWRGVWPGGAHERLPLAAAIIGLAGTASALSKGALVRLATRAAASAVVVWMLAWPLLGGAPVAARTLIWLPGLAGAVLAWWSLVDAAAGRERGAAPALLLWVTASAASLLLLFGAHFISQSLLAAAVAGAAGALVVCAWWRPTASAQGAAGVVAALLACGLMLGYLAQGLPPWMIGLNMLVPFCVVIRRVPPAARLRPWAATLACVVAGLLLVAAPVAVAFRAYTASPY